ncbi:MAG: hypothetical protein KF898_06575 [Parachlamydiales bacterium]|nr:hypothetical protein [Verrucomicrobiota bacterium]MBX3719296.1 hypothetical protein [Candidatus Acheromyda pituitae]
MSSLRAYHRGQARVQPSGRKTLKSVIFQSWWMLLFAGGCFVIYTQAMQKKALVAKGLQEQLNHLSVQKEQLLVEHEDLVLQIQSQSDPAWIQLTLMKGLGLVPDGQMKIFFQSEPKATSKDGQAA